MRTTKITVSPSKANVFAPRKKEQFPLPVIEQRDQSPDINASIADDHIPLIPTRIIPIACGDLVGETATKTRFRRFLFVLTHTLWEEPPIKADYQVEQGNAASIGLPEK
jgi:hypothetical protein